MNNSNSNIVELSDFKDKANVYYQQLTKAAPSKGLGSHEHIYLPQNKSANNYDSLLEALKRCKDYLSVKYPKEASILNDIDTLLQNCEQ